MPKVLALRPLTNDETRTIDRLAHSRTEAARTVERAQIIWQAQGGARVPAIARRLGLCEATVRLWLTRFNAQGLDGLVDAPRAGRPATYTPEEIGTVIATSLTPPDDLDLPFGSWTLDRLAAYLHEVAGIAIKRSRIGELLQAEGLRWRTQETWFGARVDPAFAEKGGDRDALHRITSGQHRRVPGRNGAGACQKLPRTTGGARPGSCDPGGGLWATRQRLHLRCLHPPPTRH